MSHKATTYAKQATVAWSLSHPSHRRNRACTLLCATNQHARGHGVSRASSGTLQVSDLSRLSPPCLFPLLTSSRFFALAQFPTCMVQCDTVRAIFEGRRVASLTPMRVRSGKLYPSSDQQQYTGCKI